MAEYFNEAINGKDVYDGERLGNERHGRGREVKADGETYEGGWSHNMREGYGVAVLAVSDLNEEEIERLRDLDKKLESTVNREKYWDKLSEKTRRQILEIRKRTALFDRYEGEWKNDLCQGHGKAFYFNGDIYEGEWCEGKPHGHGTLYKKHGKTIETEWDAGQMKACVKGRIEYPDGIVYKGEITLDSPDGQGVLTLADGTSYEGVFMMDGLPSGEYTVNYVNGDIYTGMVINGMPNGNDANMTYANGDEYWGDFLNGKRSGNGMMVYHNGDMEDGIWENDVYIGE